MGTKKVVADSRAYTVGGAVRGEVSECSAPKVYVLAGESPIFAVEVSKQSKACYSCICCVFFLECAIVHFRH